MRLAHCGRRVVLVEALLHADPVVFAREQLAEHIERLLLDVSAEILATPGVAHQGSGAVEATGGEQRAR